MWVIIMYEERNDASPNIYGLCCTQEEAFEKVKELQQRLDTFYFEVEWVGVL